MFFRKTKPPMSRRIDPPQERIRLTDNLSVPIWLRRDPDGKQHLYWSLDRVNEANESRPFRLLRPSDVLELPEFTRQLCEVLADLRGLPLALRKELARVSAAMAQVNELSRRSHINGEDDDAEASTQC